MSVWSLVRWPFSAVGWITELAVEMNGARQQAARVEAAWAGDMDALNEIEAELDGLPGGPYLPWPKAEDEPPLRKYCNQCGTGFNVSHTCGRNKAAEEESPVEHAFFPCGVYAPDRDTLLPYRCSLEDGHTGIHVAWAGKLPIAEWDDGADFVREPSLPKSSPVPPAGADPAGVEASPTLPPAGTDIEITASERGFERYGEVETAYGHKVAVYESSSASGPHLWLSVEHDGGNSYSPHSARAHLTVEQAVQIRDRLQVGISRAIRNLT